MTDLRVGAHKASRVATTPIQLFSTFAISTLREAREQLSPSEYEEGLRLVRQFVDSELDLSVALGRRVLAT